MSVFYASTTPRASASASAVGGAIPDPKLPLSSPSTPRARGDSGSSEDSALSLDSLREALPASHELVLENSPSDDQPTAKSNQTASTGLSQQDYFGEEANRAYEEQLKYEDEHMKAIRRYSAEIAHHTAHMFETCYGAEAIPEPEERQREEAAKAKIAKKDRRSSQPMKRSS